MDGGKADADEEGEVRGDHGDIASVDSPEGGGFRFATWTACGYFEVTNKAKAVPRAKKIGTLLFDSQLGRIVATIRQSKHCVVCRADAISGSCNACIFSQLTPRIIFQLPTDVRQ